MAIDNFIPEVWAARLQQNLHKALVYGQPGIVNRDYEGDIRDVGDTVRINSIGAVSIGDYTKNTDMNSAETLTDSQTTLLINQAHYFNFQVDDIDRAQQKPKVMDEAMREAAYGLGGKVDAYIAGLYTDAATANLIGTTAAPKTDLATAGKPYEYLTQLATKLDEADIPQSDRFVIVPPWFHNYLRNDTKFLQATQQGEDRLANGIIGQVAGLTVYQSNNVPFAAGPIKYKIVAGHPMAWTLAVQINRVEAYRPQLRFADAMKGLLLFGAKVTRPAALAVLTANPT